MGDGDGGGGTTAGPAAGATARTPTLAALPPTFAATREALRALSCFVISPARHALTGRIGLRPFGDGFATPPLPDGTRIAVSGDRLVAGDGRSVPITTLRAGAELLGVTLSPEPPVGHDLPPFEPDVPLAVDRAASLALGAWYRFGQQVLDALADGSTAVGEAQLWPEHFDLAVVVETAAGAANVGASPGDAYHDDPYLYVGPHEQRDRPGAIWNAPFGALLGHAALRDAPDPVATGLAFVREALVRL